MQNSGESSISNCFKPSKKRCDSEMKAISVTIANCIISRFSATNDPIIFPIDSLFQCIGWFPLNLKLKTVFLSKFVQIRFALKILLNDYFTIHNSHKTLELNLHLMCAQICCFTLSHHSLVPSKPWQKKMVSSSPLDFIEIV